MNKGKFNELSEKLIVLGVPDKLRMLELLAREGKKSISDISRDLKIHFSTTHKYLEQLEKIGLVKSDIVKEDRLKRYFSIKDFNLCVSPEMLTTSVPHEKLDVAVIDRRGNVVTYSRDHVVRPFNEAGIPYSDIKVAVEAVESKLYPGITTIEIARLFDKVFTKRSELLSSALKKVEAGRSERGNFESILKYFHPDVLKLHENGDIFISNLGDPVLLNFAHDVHGITIHGLNGEAPKKIKDVLEMILTAIQTTQKYVIGPHSIDSINYFLAPFAKSVNRDELESELSNFLKKLDKFGAEVYLNLDLSFPRFAEFISPKYSPAEYTLKGEEIDSYSNYKDPAKNILEIIIEIVRNNKFKNINIILKKWNEKDSPQMINGFYVADLSAEWQTVNANYIGPFARFDSSWKRWFRSVRIGEAQNIIINLPRLALSSNSFEQFLTELRDIIAKCIDASISISELLQGHFLRNNLKTHFYSQQKRQWSYVHIDDCLCNISVTGLKEVVDVLCVQYGKKPEVVSEILSEFNELILKVPVRLAIKEELNPLIADRFYTLDKLIIKEKGFVFDKYSPGASGVENNGELHKFFLGGHLLTSKKLTTDFGLIRLS